MAFVTTVAGDPGVVTSNEVYFQATSMTPDDVLTLQFNDGTQLQLTNYDDNEADDIMLGRPVGQNYINLSMWYANTPATLTLKDMDGNTVWQTTDATLDSSGAYVSFRITNDAGTLTITENTATFDYVNTTSGEFADYTPGDTIYSGPICFVAGTLVATPAGPRAVESLQIGDQVLTADGSAAPVKWIGRQGIPTPVARRFGHLPVCVTAGALGDGVPNRDLYLSPDHALLVDGTLAHALALCNGVTIFQVPRWTAACVEYYHIELENHELVLAEGAPAETFVDNVSRRRFDNWQEFAALYGEERPVPELALPRVKNKRQLSQRTRQRLLAIAREGARNIA